MKIDKDIAVLIARERIVIESLKTEKRGIIGIKYPGIC